jgi:hypothetical protein
VANKRGERTIRSKDESFRLAFTTNAIAQAEERLGYGIGVVMQNYMSANFSMRETIVLLWAGLLKYQGDEGLSVEDAGEILDDIIAHTKDLGGVFESLMGAIEDALPFKNQAANTDTVPQTLRTGTRQKKNRATSGNNSGEQQQGAA